MAAAGIKPESQVSGIMISEKTKPASTRICCLKTEIFSSSLAHRPHVSSENGHQKRSREWRFLETPAYRFCVDRQKRSFSNMVKQKNSAYPLSGHNRILIVLACSYKRATRIRIR